MTTAPGSAARPATASDGRVAVDRRAASSPRAAALLRAAFGLVARRRAGGRAVHAPGAVFDALAEVPSRSWATGVDLFDTPGGWPAVARFSRGLGLHPSLPDVLGLAVRVESAVGPRDLLVDSVLGDGPGWRRAGRLGQDHLAPTYSSLVVYELGAGGAPVLLLALPARPAVPRPPAAGRGRLADLAAVPDLGGFALDLGLAGRGGGPVRLARLHLRRRLPDGTEPRFDPTATGTLLPAGPLGRARAAAYPGAPVRPG
jgi:hypothetical protein